MAYFELKTPRDMLEKARREYQRLEEQFNIDNVFNFFVTAYHIIDYIKVPINEKKTNAVKQIDIDTFLSDRDIQDCHDLCDKGKHLKLDKNGRQNPVTRIQKGYLNAAPLNTLTVNGGDKWVFSINDRTVDIKPLAKRVLTKWEDFFKAHAL